VCERECVREWFEFRVMIRQNPSIFEVCVCERVCSKRESVRVIVRERVCVRVYLVMIRQRPFLFQGVCMCVCV